MKANETIIEEGLEDEQTLLDPRDRYNDEVEEYIAKKKQGLSIWQHVFMVVLLLTIIMVYVKNNLLYTNEDYSYLLALALPIFVLTVIFGVIIYEKYLWKLSDSHRSTYIKLMTLLIVTSVCLVASVALLSLYLS